MLVANVRRKSWCTKFSTPHLSRELLACAEAVEGSSGATPCGKKKRRVAGCFFDDAAGHRTERDFRNTRVLGNLAGESDRSISYPFPAQPRDLREPLSREDEKLNNRSIRIADFPRPFPHFAQFIVGQDAVARLLSGFLDAHAR